MVLYTSREALTRLVDIFSSKKIIDVSGLSGDVNGGNSISDVLQVPDYRNNVAIEVNITYSNSATSGGKLLVYCSMDGVNFDTDTDDVIEIPFVAGATKQKTFKFIVPVKFIKIEIVNSDSSNSLIINHVKAVFF